VLEYDRFALADLDIGHAVAKHLDEFLWRLGVGDGHGCPHKGGEVLRLASLASRQKYS
jgi:hypothetical protein